MHDASFSEHRAHGLEASDRSAAAPRRRGRRDPGHSGGCGDVEHVDDLQVRHLVGPD